MNEAGGRGNIKKEIKRKFPFISGKKEKFLRATSIKGMTRLKIPRSSSFYLGGFEPYLKGG